MFSQLKTVILAAAAVLTVVPGASLVTGLVELPVDFNKFLSFCAAVTGPIIFFLVYLTLRKLLALRPYMLMAIIGASTVAGLAFAWEAYSYTTQQIIPIPTLKPDNSVKIERYILPETLSPELDTFVNGQHRGNWENAILAGGDAVTGMMSKDSLPVQRRILIVFLLAQNLLIFACLTAAWAVARQLPRQN